jgi:ABC-type sugar transport system permease subunit
MKAGIRSYETAQHRSQRRWLGRLEPYAWVAPAVAVFFIFTLLPLLVGFWLSFVDWDGIATLRWVGFQNYVGVFHDTIFWQAIEHNAIYAVGTVLGKVGLALVLAVLLNQALPGRAIFRTALFLPVVLSFVVVGLLWNWIYNFNFGLVNGLLGAIGLSALKQQWLGNPSLALPALIVVDIWKWFGFHMVIFLAGLQSIPAELYEAARIDGANGWQSFWRVTLPLLRPVTMINVTLGTLGAFNVFDLIYVTTTGGPAYATNVAMMDIYTQAFQFYRFGYAAALSFVLLTLVSIIALVVLRTLNSERYF